VLGSRVFCFNFHRWSCTELAFTAALNAVGRIQVDHIVFDDMRRPVYVNESRETRSDEPGKDKDEYVLQASTFDQYAARKAIDPIDLFCVDDVNFETRIIRGALGSIKYFRPALLIRCYRHGAHNVGASTAELLRVLNRIDYLAYYASWDGEVRDLQLIENDVEPTLDTFLLYAFGREYAPFLLNQATGKIGDARPPKPIDAAIPAVDHADRQDLGAGEKEPHRRRRCKTLSPSIRGTPQSDDDALRCDEQPVLRGVGTTGSRFGETRGSRDLMSQFSSLIGPRGLVRNLDL
jgi:hypothetical protein